MGNILTCCVAPNCGQCKRKGSVESDCYSEVYGDAGAQVTAPRKTKKFSKGASDGHHQEYIHYWKMPKEGASKLNPSDDPKIGTIFLSKSHTYVHDQRNNTHLKHGFGQHLGAKSLGQPDIREKAPQPLPEEYNQSCLLSRNCSSYSVSSTNV
ncbi:cyclin-Y-like protein 1 [Cavia porcellus]|uniref:cyclin-Y-like protein 1 n=1 Tax=Cavia porcellus TaxID=10141 RepID=UPI002FE3EB82